MPMRSEPAASGPSEPKAFGALRLPGYRIYLATFALTMMADNVEHVISYWVAFQKFHSAALGGFAVVSHWVPYLFLAGFTGRLADRVDIRRLIQIGMGLFISRMIVEGHGGSVRVKSQPGRTTFDVSLPLYDSGE